MSKEHAIDRLFALIESRVDADPKASYTAKLLKKGPSKIAQKLGEEAVETALAAVDPQAGKDDLAAESADLLYHLLVLWAAKGVRPDQVWEELNRRAGTSGLAEKAARKKGD